MSSGFITEAEIEERRRVRQQEWEKVRQPGQPEEAPEEEHDNRSLFERLEEQRQKKELDFEETHRLKNMIKGLDDDEIEFLDLVDRTKMEAEKRLLNEEAKELELFRSRKAALREQTMAQKIEEEVAPVISSINEAISAGIAMPHNKALANLVKKRAATDKLPSPPAKKPAEGVSKSSVSDTKESESLKDSAKNCGDGGVVEDKVENPVLTYPAAMQCIGILPGIGSYISEDSSDSDKTSNSDLEDMFDFRGQKMQKNASKQSLS